MDRSDLEAWIARYRQAWTTDDRDDIAALFTEGASYSPWPFTTPYVGRDRIVERWLAHGDATRSWSFAHDILAFEGNTGVVRGMTHYDPFEDEPEATYSNIWLIRLDPDGRAREFAEWWVEKPSETPRG